MKPGPEIAGEDLRALDGCGDRRILCWMIRVRGDQPSRSEWSKRSGGNIRLCPAHQNMGCITSLLSGVHCRLSVLILHHNQANKTQDRKQPGRLFEPKQQKDSTVLYWMILATFGIGALRKGYNGRLGRTRMFVWPPSILYSTNNRVAQDLAVKRAQCEMVHTRAPRVLQFPPCSCRKDTGGRNYHSGPPDRSLLLNLPEVRRFLEPAPDVSPLRLYCSVAGR